MFDLNTEEEVVKCLQGSWSSKNEKMSFDIINMDIVNIIGVKDFADVDITEASYTVDRDASKEMWVITNLSVLNAHKNPISIEGNTFLIMDLNWPAKVLLEFDRKKLGL